MQDGGALVMTLWFGGGAGPQCLWSDSVIVGCDNLSIAPDVAVTGGG